MTGTATAPGLRSYSIVGVRCSVSAPAAILDGLDATYGTFGAEPGTGDDVLHLTVEPVGGGLAVAGPGGTLDRVPGEEEAAIAVYNRLGAHVVAQLAAGGVYAIHGAALVHGGGAVILAGRSGAGKTTLALALLRRGLRLLSDELALPAADGATILPYRRALHVRPDTARLVRGLDILAERPRRRLGGGNEWAVLPTELERVLPGCLGEPAPLRHVVLLGERRDAGRAELEPISAAVAAVELVASTPAAASGFEPVLDRLTRLADRTRCARLHAAGLRATVDVLLDWLGPADGR